MLPTPQIGQFVRLDDYRGRLSLRTSAATAPTLTWSANVTPTMNVRMFHVSICCWLKTIHRNPKINPSCIYSAVVASIDCSATRAEFG
jgi:hypothetical protein